MIEMDSIVLAERNEYLLRAIKYDRLYMNELEISESLERSLASKDRVIALLEEDIRYQKQLVRRARRHGWRDRIIGILIIGGLVITL